MKKLLTSIALSGALFASSMQLLPVNKAKEILNASIFKIQPYYRFLARKGVIKYKVYKSDDFYVVKLSANGGSEVYYVTLDKKYTVSGNVIDNSKGSYLVPPANKKIVDNGVVFTFGKGKKDIYVVTDPECPFCRRLEREKGKYLEEHYRIHVIFMPLVNIHKDAVPMIYYILAGKTKAEQIKRFKEVLKGSNAWKNYHPTKEEKEKFNKIIVKSIQAANELGASGTPSVYNDKLKPIDNWKKIGEEK